MLSKRALVLGAAGAMFNSNGINQQTADLYLRPQPLRGNDATTLAGRTQVDPSAVAGAVNLIFVGQSTNK
jgi:hypothetical protein